MTKDNLGDRMKGDYESRTRFLLPRRSHTMLRIDGKAFHTYTKGLKRPFDDDLIDDMNQTAAYLCKGIQGAQCAYVQSDEISILVLDSATVTTDAWFDNNVQKMASVSASMATVAFNRARLARLADISGIQTLAFAEFDSRVFQIPQAVEVENYFIWRQQDAIRNSVQAAAQANFSAKQLHGKSVIASKQMLLDKGFDWDALATKYKNGRMIVRVAVEVAPTVIRHKWQAVDTPVFADEADRVFLRTHCVAL